MFTKPRIASLCPSNTEIVDALGLADCLVGVDNYSDWPPTLGDDLPRLGPDLSIDIDRLIALRPDLTIASLSVPGMEKVVAAVDAAGLNYIALCPHTIEDMFADMRAVAQALPGTMDATICETTVYQLQKRVERVQIASDNVIGRPKLYFEWWPSPVFSPAGRNWLSEVSQLAGAHNIFADVDGDQVQDDGHRVTFANPDYFFAVWTGVPQHKVPLQKILNRPGWETTTAFERRQVYILSEGLYCRPSPRLVDGLEQLFTLLWPEQSRELGLPPAEQLAPVRTANGEWLGGISPEPKKIGLSEKAIDR